MDSQWAHKIYDKKYQNSHSLKKMFSKIRSIQEIHICFSYITFIFNDCKELVFMLFFTTTKLFIFGLKKNQKKCVKMKGKRRIWFWEIVRNDVFFVWAEVFLCFSWYCRTNCNISEKSSFVITFENSTFKLYM